MATKKRMVDYRYRLIVTFDVPGAKGGDHRYGAVDDLLREHGDLTMIFKQVRLLATQTLPSRLAPLISDIVGPKGAVLIVHAAKPYRFVLGNQNVKAPTRPWVRLWMGGAK
jgi:hypothetical protein